MKHCIYLSNISIENPSMMCLQPINGGICPGNSGGPSTIKMGSKFVQGMTIILY